MPRACIARSKARQGERHSIHACALAESPPLRARAHEMPSRCARAFEPQAARQQSRWMTWLALHLRGRGARYPTGQGLCVCAGHSREYFYVRCCDVAQELCCPQPIALASHRAPPPPVGIALARHRSRHPPHLDSHGWRFHEALPMPDDWPRGSLVGGDETSALSAGADPDLSQQQWAQTLIDEYK